MEVKLPTYFFEFLTWFSKLKPDWSIQQQQTSDQAILIVAILTTTSNRWSLSVGDEDDACIAGGCHSRSCDHKYVGSISGLVVAN